MEKNLLIIPNTIDPYGYETIPILTYPNGFEYRFRFEEEWVEQSLERILSKLVNKKGYIVLRDFDTGTLYPTRYFTVKNAEKIGKIYYFQIKLQDLVSYDSQNDHRENQLNEFNEEFFKFHTKYTFNNSPEKNMRPLVFLTNFECDIKNVTGTDSNSKNMENWGNILSCYRDIKFFNNVQFLRIIDVNPLDKKIGHSKFDNGALVLKEGADYEIKIAQFITKATEKLTPSDIKIEADEKAISVLRGHLRAVGKYDILSFIIRTNKDVISGASFLDILYLPKSISSNSDPSTLAGDPRLSIPVKIQSNSRSIFYRAIFLILFAILYFCPSFLPLIPWPWLKNQASFLQDLSLVGVTVSYISVLKEIKRTKN